MFWKKKKKKKRPAGYLNHFEAYCIFSANKPELRAKKVAHISRHQQTEPCVGKNFPKNMVKEAIAYF